MSQSEESINLLSPSLDDLPPPTTNKDDKTPPSHDKNENAKGNGNDVQSIPQERTTSKPHHPKQPTAFASRRQYTKAYTQTKGPSDDFLRRTVPFRTSKTNIRIIESISKDMEVSLLLNSTVEVPREDDRGGGGFIMSQLTCLEGGTQMYTGRRDDEDCQDHVDEEKDGEERLLEVEEEHFDIEDSVGGGTAEEENEDGREKTYLDQEEEDEDEELFEFNGSQEKERKKSRLESKPKHDKVTSQSAGAKRRKKGPTEKALAECTDLTHSTEERMTHIDDLDNESNNDEYVHHEHDEDNVSNQVDFENHDDADDPFEQKLPTNPNSQTHTPTSSNKHSPIQTISPTHPTQTAQQTILTNYTAIENMSRALTCPICCHSLKSATFLPCGHAFCKTCLSSSFSASATKSAGGLGVGSCPVCRLKCGKRSMMPIAQLDEIVRAYKGIMRAFGFAPVVFSKKVMMTQLSPGEDGEWEEDEEEDGRERRGTGGGWKRRKLNVTEALEHHQVVLSNHAAFATFQEQQAASTAPAQRSGNRMTKEELERINLTRRYQILTKDQEAILQADKEALERATRRKQRIAEETAAFALNGGVKGSSQIKGIDAGGEKQLAPAAPAQMDDQRKLPPILAPMESQDTFHTAKSGYSTVKETSQPRRSSALTAPSPTILHDGNTAKKAEKDRSLTSPVGRLKGRALETSDDAANYSVAFKQGIKGGTRNQSFATVESPVVVHDGNTARKKSKSDNTPTPRRSGKFLQQPAMDAEDEKVKRTEVAAAYDPCELVDNMAFDTVGLESSQQSSIVSAESMQEPLASDNDPCPSSNEEMIVEGSVVMVQARTWPGINKHGGVGRVTRVDSSGHSKKYDVSYILGGKEKGVDESFVSLHDSERNETAELTVAARVSRSAEKASSRRKRIAVAKETEPSVSISIYNDDELQHIPVDVLAWAGLVRPAKGKRGTTNRKESKSNGVSNTGVRCSKGVLAESNTNVAPSKKIKKRKATASLLQKRDSKAQAALADHVLTSFQSATESLTTDELVKRADARYASLLSSDEDSSFTISAITSSLTDQDTKLLNSFVKMLKAKNVTLKVTKDFKPGKTQLCITSVLADSSHEINIVSKSRTLKVMRSALLGLPILTPRWMESCISNTGLVAPTGDMCVRSLPRKVASKDDHLARFGVAKYAAAVDSTISKVLDKCAVLLCGEWKSTGQSTLKDLKLLLQDAGATIVNSETVASKMMGDISDEDASVGHFVFLCDDSHLDVDCGVSETLLNAGKLAISQNQRNQKKVLTVHFHWLFDCISCAKVMPGAAYEPLAPRTRALWSLCCESVN